jgi:hypothetical protein
MVQGREEQRLKAAMELWNIASHQGNSGPSAVPVSEFLFEMLEEQPPPVQVEIPGHALPILDSLSKEALGRGERGAVGSICQGASFA